MVYITRRVTFNAAHRLHNPDLTDKENKKIFGICNNPNGHGHNYTLEVTVKGEVAKKTGMVINLHELKEIISTAIIKKLDHKHLNHDVDFLKNTIPTAENLVVNIWKILKKRIPKEHCELYELKLYETENNIVVFKGE